MNFKNLGPKHAIIAPLIYGTLGGAFTTMINSINSGITWKIVFSVTAFIVFAGFAAVYSVGIYKEISESESNV